jgi:hypothetical protein
VENDSSSIFRKINGSDLAPAVGNTVIGSSCVHGTKRAGAFGKLEECRPNAGNNSGENK